MTDRKTDEQPGRVLEREIVVPAAPEAVWEAWTTEDGVRTFFAPRATVSARPGGAYEMYFLLDAPPGQQGSEGCVVLVADPGERLSFTWNFPPHLPSIRGERTRVDVAFAPVAVDDGDATRVTVRHTGWRAGADWDEGYAYFERAWSLVLERLRERFTSGRGIDWAVR